MKLIFSVAGLLLTGLIVGCGGGGETFDRVAVSGTVSLEGDSSRSGSIIATADIDNGTSEGGRPTTQALLVEGKFEFTADRGPAPGDYVFEISLTPLDAEFELSEDGETETSDEAELYKKIVTIPAGGTDSLAIELTNSDRSRADGSGPMPSSGER